MGAIDRIIQIIENQHISLASFESKCGLSSGYLSKMKKRSANVGEDILCKILENCPDVSPEWILTGEGEMIKSTYSSVKIGNNNINTQVGNGNTISNNQEEVSALKEENAILRAKYSELEKRYDDLIGRLAGK